MGAGDVILTFGYPLLLLAGALCRINLPSFIYLISFIVTVVWSPHVLLTSRKKLVTVVLWILSFYTGLQCVGHVVFQSILASKYDYGRRFLAPGSPTAIWLQYAGFERLLNVGEGFRLITPDVVLFLVTTALLICVQKGLIFSKISYQNALEHMGRHIPRSSSTLNTVLLLSCLFINGLSFASGLQSVYFILFMAALVSKAFLRLRLSHTVSLMYYPVLLYNILHILGSYIYQAEPIESRIPAKWAQTLGLKYYLTDITPVALVGVSICAAWAASILLVIILAFRKLNSDLRALGRIDRGYLENESPKHKRARSLSQLRSHDRFAKLRPYVREWGWRICVLALLAIPLFLPSFFSVFLLFAVCLASVVPQIVLEKYWIIPGVTLYLILITCAQYVYNIPNIGSPCRTNERSALCAIGLRLYDYTWFQIGLQALVCLLLAINWGFYKSGMTTKNGVPLSDGVVLRDSLRPSIRQRSGGKNKNNLLSEDAEEEEGEEAGTDMETDYEPSPTTSLLSDHESAGISLDHDAATDSMGPPIPSSNGHKSKDHSHRDSQASHGSYSGLEGEEDEEDASIMKSCLARCKAWWVGVRPAAKAIGFWALKQSYLLSLCGVYVAGLHQVNALNTGYLFILILFLTDSRIARKAWLLLVLYCEAVILLVYTWSATPWTKNLSDHTKNVILPQIGLTHYETTNDLFSLGLVWHLIIMVFAVMQLWVLRYTQKVVAQGKDKPSEKIPRWMRSVGNVFFWAWNEYGLIPVYTVLVLVSSLDDKISVVNILYILLLFVCLTIHMITRRAEVHIKRFWIFVVVATGVILLARYAYQFPFIHNFLPTILPVDFITALGLIHFPPGPVFRPLLGNTIVLLVAVIQLQTFFSKKADVVDAHPLGHNPHARRMINSDADDSTRYTDDESYKSSSSDGSSKIAGKSGYAKLIAEDSDMVESGRAERPMEGSEHLLRDEDLMEADIKAHPHSTKEERKHRLKKEHRVEAVLYNWLLDLIYWMKRFFMLHAYKITALVMVAVCVHTPSGLNSIYLEVVVLSVAADHMTDGVGLLLLSYTQITVLFTLIYQFQGVFEGLAAYLPLVKWAGFFPAANPYNRLPLILSKLLIIAFLLVQRFSHRWKNDWYRIKKHELQEEIDMRLEAARSGGWDTEPSAGIQAFSDTSSSSSSLPVGTTKTGLLHNMTTLMNEDEFDNDQVEALRSQYLHKTELALFLYEPSEHLILSQKFTWREMWNCIAWFLSNIMSICGYQILCATLLMAIYVHFDTVYGVVFLLILGITLLTSTKRWNTTGFAIKTLTIFVAIELLLQYIMNLDLPPPDLRYPWSTWNPVWLSWLGLKAPHASILLADFALLMVAARLRRLTPIDQVELKMQAYWHYLVGPVLKDFNNSRTWSDSVRYFIYRFSPFVVLLLIFIAGTIEPNVLSFIYVLFALLFIFRESTIYSQRNKIWRWARLYNYLLLLIIILYQIPVIKLPEGNMSFATIIGLRKSNNGSTVLFSLFIFVFLSVQKRLFSRREFDELVLSILDEEERGVRLAQERFQEWKIERHQEFERVQEEKRKRRHQLDLLKAARQRQQKLWMAMSKEKDEQSRGGTSLPGGPNTLPGMMPGQNKVMGDSYMHDPRMMTMSTTRDLEMLQKQGGLSIQEDKQGHTLRMKFTNPKALGSKGSTLLDRGQHTMDKRQSMDTGDYAAGSSRSSFAGSSRSSFTGSSFLHQSNNEELVLAARSPSPDDDETDDNTSDSSSHSSDEEDVLAQQLKQSREPHEEKELGLSLDEEDKAQEGGNCCTRCTTPKWILAASDYCVGWLDKQTMGYLSNKPHYSRPKKLWVGVYKLYQLHSHLLCYLTFMINAMVNADLISLFYPVSMFMYALLETPRPHKVYWNTVFVYAATTMLVKFFYQFKLFCVCDVNGYQSWALASTCYPTIGRTICQDPDLVKKTDFTFSPPRVIGITHYSRSFIREVLPDLFVLIAVFMHRYWLKKHGYWSFVQRLTLSKGGDELMTQQQLQQEAKRFERVLIRQQKKRELWTRFAAEKKKRRLTKRLSKMESVSSIAQHGLYPEEDIESGGIIAQQSIDSPSSYRHSTIDSPSSYRRIVDSPSSYRHVAPPPKDGMKVMPNPLFKMNDSDFETDVEEMATLPCSSPPRDAKSVHFKQKDISSSILAHSDDPYTARASRRNKQEEKAGMAANTNLSSSGFSDSDVITIGKPSKRRRNDDDDGVSSSSSDSSNEYSDDEEEDEYFYEERYVNRRRKCWNTVKRKFKQAWTDTKHYYKNVVAHKPGRELYIHVWFVELLCFFFILILPAPFIGNSSGNVAEFLTQSRLPNSYVLTLLVQFIFIVVERVLYLYRASKLKLIYHICLVIFYHIWLCFITPIFTGEDFRSQPILIAFYLLKLGYMYLSSLQIMYGYPAFVQGQFLTDSREPGLFRNYVYIAYRAIPFVYELRTLLDWTVTKTSLTFYEWLKCEDIYANLFLVKCRVSQDKHWQRNVGDPQKWYTKLGMGVLLFIALAAVIWFPLLLLMQGSPGNSVNPVIEASLSIGFQGYASPIFTAVSSGPGVNISVSTSEFNLLRIQNPAITYDDYEIMQRIEFENFSDVSWAISPPARAALLADLEHSRSQLNIHATFTRTVAVNGPQVAACTWSASLSNGHDQAVIGLLNGTKSNVTIPDVIQRYFRVPNAGDAVNITNSHTSATFSINGVGTPQPYWTATQVAPRTDTGLPWDTNGKIQFITFSAKAPTGILKNLASIGLIGLYVGIVLAVARFLRLAITDLAFRIIYEDMPVCEELISYCEDIFMARQDGDLVLEEELFRELIELYRSPERIILRTLPSAPRFAGRKPTSKKSNKKKDDSTDDEDKQPKNEEPVQVDSPDRHGEQLDAPVPPSLAEGPDAP